MEVRALTKKYIMQSTDKVPVGQYPYILLCGFCGSSAMKIIMHSVNCVAAYCGCGKKFIVNQK